MNTKRLRLVVVASSAAGLLAACRRNGPEQTEILWDVWGIPHVYEQPASELDS
jgi:hypothetical protein